jgi:hypothetical protein
VTSTRLATLMTYGAASMTHPLLAHRAVSVVPTTPPLIEGTAIGGDDAIRTVVERLYDGIEGDRDLRTKFGSDLEGERRKLGAFVVEFLGGRPEWNTPSAPATACSRHSTGPGPPCVAPPRCAPKSPDSASRSASAHTRVRSNPAATTSAGSRTHVLKGVPDEWRLYSVTS